MHFFDGEDLLSYAEIATFVREVAVPLGVTRLRLTGGEPLVRPDLASLAADLAAIPAITDLALTTNGVLLASQARGLRAAGVQRLNVSVDSLDADRYRAITRGADLARAWAGLEAAQSAGFDPIKLNCVVMRGFNEDEVADFVALTVERPWHVRFIEFMPIGDHDLFTEVGYVPTLETQARIGERFRLQPLAERSFAGNGPARYWQVPGARGTVGFISQMSHDFCEACNRIRLTSDGRLRHCLLSDHELDIRAMLRGGASPAALREAIVADLQHKLERHRGVEGIAGHVRTMSQIGG